MNILIHIGYPKTATSWFQFRLFPYVRNMVLVERNDIVNILIQPNALDFDPATARRFFLSKYGENMVLSLEGFIGTAHNFGLNGYMVKEHAQRLHSVFPEGKVILFIRHQREIISSFYLQYISGGGTYGINAYLHRRHFRGLNGLPLFSFNFFEFHKVADLYADLFGREQLHLFIFEDFKADNTKFIFEFCKRFSLDVDLEKLNYSIENLSLRAAMRYIFWFANLFTSRNMLNKYYVINIPFLFDFHKPFLEHLNHYKIFGPHVSSIRILGKKNILLIDEYFKESNRQLMLRYDLKQLKKYNYPL